MISRSSDTDSFRNLSFEQYYFDKISKLTAEDRKLLPDKILKKISGKKGTMVRERFETKAKIFSVLNTRFAIIFWEGDMSDEDANSIFRSKYTHAQWEDAQRLIFDKNVFIIGDKSWSEWMMLSEFYFDTPYYTLTRKLKAPQSQSSKTSVTKIIDDNKTFFRSIYSMLMKYDNMGAYLKTYNLTKSELHILFCMFNQHKPMVGTDLQAIDGLKMSRIYKLLKQLVEKGLIENERMRSTSNPISNKGEHYILTGKGYIVLGEITHRLFKDSEI